MSPEEKGCPASRSSTAAAATLASQSPSADDRAEARELPPADFASIVALVRSARRSFHLGPRRPTPRRGQPRTRRAFRSRASRSTCSSCSRRRRAGNLTADEATLLRESADRAARALRRVERRATDPGVDARCGCAAPGKVNLGLRVTRPARRRLPPAREPVRADRRSRTSLQLELRLALRRSRSTLTGEHAAGVPRGRDATSPARAAAAFAGRGRRSSRASRSALEKRAACAGRASAAARATRAPVLRGLAELLTGRRPHPPADLARSRSGSAPTCRSSWRPGRRSSRASARRVQPRAGAWAALARPARTPRPWRSKPPLSTPSFDAGRVR